MPIWKSQVVTCTSDQLAINWGFPWPLLGLNDLLEWPTELRETLNLLDHQFIIQDATQEQPDGRDFVRQGMGKRHRASMRPLNTLPSQCIHVFTHLGALWVRLSRVFMEFPLHRTWLIKSLAIHDWTQFPALSPWRLGVGADRATSLITGLVPLALA